MSRLLRMLGVVLGAIACLAPPATLAVLIGRFGVNIPYTDQWELVLLMQKERRVGLTFGDLVAQHGEQRMVFPRMVMLALARLTNWNIRAELLVNLLLAAGMMIILFWMLSRSLSGSGKWLMTPVASASLMIFSPVQWETGCGVGRSAGSSPRSACWWRWPLWHGGPQIGPDGRQ